MKKLVFLHGAGADCCAYHDLMSEIVQYFNAELITFNAPFLHLTKQDKFVWFNKIEQNGRRDAICDEYFASVEYIKNKLQELNADLSEVILIGHSQGGGMAVHIGLDMDLGAVIAISADMPYNIAYENNSKTPIYWFEAGQDGYIDENRKASYKLLQQINANLHYQILPTSTHNEFANELLSAIKDCFKMYDNNSKATLYLICGFLGAGKTTFSKKLAREKQAIHLNPDEACCKLFSKQEYENNWEECFAKTMDILWNEATKAIKSGTDVIFDAGFWSKASRDKARQKARDIGAEPIVYYLYAPDEELKHRISQRKGRIAENNIKNFQTIKKLFEEPSGREIFVRINHF